MATKFKSSVEIDGYLSLTSGNWVQVPDGTTAQRPGSPTVGMFRYNTTTNEFEGYFGSTPAWGAIGGGGGGRVGVTVVGKVEYVYLTLELVIVDDLLLLRIR